MDIVQKVKKYVREECKKPTSKYGYEAYSYHFVSMVKYAEKLADKMGGDKEVILVAAWLHDIGSTICGRDNHHVTGAKIAEKKLRELKYPEKKIELIKKCILNHRGSVGNNRDTIEEKIISEADTMSAFDNISGLFKAAFVYEDKDQGEARDSVNQKLERKWKRLHFDSSKKIIEPKYKAAMILLDRR